MSVCSFKIIKFNQQQNKKKQENNVNDNHLFGQVNLWKKKNDFLCSKCERKHTKKNRKNSCNHFLQIF